MATASRQRVLARLLFIFTTLIGLSQARAASQEITADIKVKLVPVVTNTDLVTDINVVDGAFYVCTQPGKLLRNSGGKTTVFLDLTSKVGPLGFGIPPLPGLGYPKEATYDERGLLGFAADPAFRSTGRFWVWYTAIKERSPAPPAFFQWLVSTSMPWDQSQYDHVGHLEEYLVVRGAPVFQRTVLKIKRPYFNHTGYQSLVWSAEHGTLMLGLGDGGSEYDPNNIAQDDDQLSGKLLKIDLDRLRGRDFTGSAPVATFTDLSLQHVDPGAFVALVKGLRNPSKVTFEETDGGQDANDGEDGNGGSRTKARWIKYLANTGQDTIEWIHGFDTYGINFGFRPWEGIFPTSFEMDVPPPSKDNRAIAYGLEASRLATVMPGVPKLYRPLVQYTHLDKNLGPNANTGSALYRGNGIPGLSGQLVFTDWISFNRTPKQGLLMHAAPNRKNLQEAQPIKLFDVDISAADLQAGQVLFFTSINTDLAGQRIFIGAYKELQFITSQAAHSGAGGVYEVVFVKR